MSLKESNTKKNYSNTHPKNKKSNIKLAGTITYMKTKIGPNRQTVFPKEIKGIKVSPGLGDLFKKQLDRAIKNIKKK